MVAADPTAAALATVVMWQVPTRCSRPSAKPMGAAAAAAASIQLPQWAPADRSQLLPLSAASKRPFQETRNLTFRARYGASNRFEWLRVIELPTTWRRLSRAAVGVQAAQ